MNSVTSADIGIPAPGVTRSAAGHSGIGSSVPKKRSKGDGALYYDKKRKLWKAVVDLDPWPDGRRRQKTVTAKLQTEARKKLTKVQAEIRDFGAPLDQTTTVAEWSAHWLTTVKKPTMAPAGLASYESVTRMWIVPLIGRKRVAAVKPSDIRLVLKAISDAGRASSTARKAYDVMSGMLESARMDGMCARNVAADVIAPAVLMKERGALTTEQTLAVLELSAAELAGTRWWMALLAGIRQSERCGARIESVDFERNVFNVEWALEEVASEHGCGEAIGGRWPCGKKRGGSCPQRRLKLPTGFEYIPLYGRLVLKRPKSGRAREVPLIPELAAALKQHIEATAHVPNPYGLLWRHDDGTPFLPWEDQQAWRDVLFEAGIITGEQRKEPKDREEGTPDIPTSHWARHTTATVLMELGVDAKIIGEVIGHGSEKVTRHYQHVSSPAARNAMELIGGRFMPALEAKSIEGSPAPQ